MVSSSTCPVKTREPEKLAEAYRAKLSAIDLSSAEREALYAELEAGLHGYTYLS